MKNISEQIQNLSDRLNDEIASIDMGYQRLQAIYLSSSFVYYQVFESMLETLVVLQCALTKDMLNLEYIGSLAQIDLDDAIASLNRLIDRMMQITNKEKVLNRQFGRFLDLDLSGNILLETQHINEIARRLQPRLEPDDLLQFNQDIAIYTRTLKYLASFSLDEFHQMITQFEHERKTSHTFMQDNQFFDSFSRAFNEEELSKLEHGCELIQYIHKKYEKICHADLSFQEWENHAKMIFLTQNNIKHVEEMQKLQYKHVSIMKNLQKTKESKLKEHITVHQQCHQSKQSTSEQSLSSKREIDARASSVAEQTASHKRQPPSLHAYTKHQKTTYRRTKRNVGKPQVDAKPGSHHRLDSAKKTAKKICGTSRRQFKKS